jgi:hypothetical protein
MYTIRLFFVKGPRFCLSGAPESHLFHLTPGVTPLPHRVNDLVPEICETCPSMPHHTLLMKIFLISRQTKFENIKI